MKTKVRKTYNYIIRFLIIIATYGFLFYQVFYRRNISDIYHTFIESFGNSNFILMILLVLVLMFFNWGTEAVKWKLLIQKIEKLSWLTSFQAVLTGIAVSSITPNRIGDYFGRVFILEKANRIEGIFITILGSMSQLLITFIMGTGSIYIMFIVHAETLLSYFKIPHYMYDYLVWGGGVLGLGLNVLLMLLFLNISLLSTLTARFKGTTAKRISSYIHVLSAYTVRELFGIMGLSAFRFIIFSTQMYILLRAFSVQLPFLQAMMIIAVIFFVMTMVPTVAITELGIRTSVALFLVGVFYGNPLQLPDHINLGIIAASTTLWMINLAIPALSGTVFVFNLKFFRKAKNE